MSLDSLGISVTHNRGKIPHYEFNFSDMDESEFKTHLETLDVGNEFISFNENARDSILNELKYKISKLKIHIADSKERIHKRKITRPRRPGCRPGHAPTANQRRIDKLESAIPKCESAVKHLDYLFYKLKQQQQLHQQQLHLMYKPPSGQGHLDAEADFNLEIERLK